MNRSTAGAGDENPLSPIVNPAPKRPVSAVHLEAMMLLKCRYPGITDSHQLDGVAVAPP
jgi:hypothetical protein